MMKAIFLVLSILVLSCQCKPLRLTEHTGSTTVIYERVRDTTIYLSDTASLSALLECDSLGQVQMREIKELKGRYIQPEVRIVNNILEVQAAIDSAAVYVKWSERDTSREETITILQPPEKIRLPLTGWQQTLMWLGKLCLIASAILGMYILARLRKF